MNNTHCFHDNLHQIEVPVCLVLIVITCVIARGSSIHQEHVITPPAVIFGLLITKSLEIVQFDYSFYFCGWMFSRGVCF